MSTGEQSDDEDVGTRETARRLAYTGLWAGRFLLGAIVLLYGLSFVAPPPVEHRSLAYDGDPSAVAADAVHNLRSDVYRYDITVTKRNATGSSVAYRSALTIDNRARQLSGWIRDGRLVGNESADPYRVYGTVGSGYSRFSPDRYAFRDEPGRWEPHAAWGYSLDRNAFRAPSLIRDAAGTVRTDNDSHYVASLDLGAVEDRVVAPPRLVRPVEADQARLTVAVSKNTDRIIWARFRAVNGSRSAVYRYSFNRGPFVDIDRPLATYPPGGEVLTRLDLGIAGIDGLVPGGGRP